MGRKKRVPNYEIYMAMKEIDQGKISLRKKAIQLGFKDHKSLATRIKKLRDNKPPIINNKPPLNDKKIIKEEIKTPTKTDSLRAIHIILFGASSRENKVTIINKIIKKMELDLNEKKKTMS